MPPPAAALAVLIAMGVALRLYRFGEPILDSQAFRQTQTASEVWLWDRLGFDLFDYHVPMLGAGHWILPPDLSAIAFIRGASPEPVYISKLAFARGVLRLVRPPRPTER